MTLVTLSAVTKSFKRGPEIVHALRGIDLVVKAGEVTALVGPSGSGKSTLLNLISGWEVPDGGTVVWTEHSDLDGARLGWDSVSLVPQRLGLLEDLTVIENIELPLVLAGWVRAEVSERSMPILDSLDLTHLVDRLPAETSLGEQQRVCIARSLVTRPQLLLADEPTGNQDHARERKVLAAFRREAQRGAGCLIATHNPEVLKQCDRVVTMHDGQIVSDEEREVQPWARSEWAP